MNQTLQDPFKIGFPDHIAHRVILERILPKDAIDADSSNISNSPVVKIAYSRLGTYLACATLDGIVYVLSTDVFSVVRTLNIGLASDQDTIGRVDQLSFSHDGAYLAVTTLEPRLYYYDLKTSELVRHIPLKAKIIYMAIVPGQKDQIIILEKGMEPELLTLLPEPQEINRLIIQPDNLKNLDVEAKRWSDQLFDYTSAALDRWGRFLLLGTNKGLFAVFHLKKKIFIHIERYSRSTIKQIIFNTNLREILFNCKNHIKVVTWEYIESNDQNELSKVSLSQATKYSGHFESGEWSCCNFDNTGEYVIGVYDGDRDHKIHIWERVGASLHSLLVGPGGKVLDLAWHPLLPTLASLSLTGKLWIWAPTYSQKWSGFSPDFSELTQNLVYRESEDAYDLPYAHPSHQLYPKTQQSHTPDGKQSNRLEPTEEDNIDVDILSVDNPFPTPLASDFTEINCKDEIGFDEAYEIQLVFKLEVPSSELENKALSQPQIDQSPLKEESNLIRSMSDTKTPIEEGEISRLENNNDNNDNDSLKENNGQQQLNEDDNQMINDKKDEDDTINNSLGYNSKDNKYDDWNRYNSRVRYRGRSNYENDYHYNRSNYDYYDENHDNEDNNSRFGSNQYRYQQRNPNYIRSSSYYINRNEDERGFNEHEDDNDNDNDNDNEFNNNYHYNDRYSELRSYNDSLYYRDHLNDRRRDSPYHYHHHSQPFDDDIPSNLNKLEIESGEMSPSQLNHRRRYSNSRYYDDWNSNTKSSHPFGSSLSTNKDNNNNKEPGEINELEEGEKSDEYHSVHDEHSIRKTSVYREEHKRWRGGFRGSRRGRGYRSRGSDFNRRSRSRYESYRPIHSREHEESNNFRSRDSRRDYSLHDEEHSPVSRFRSARNYPHPLSPSSSHYNREHDIPFRSSMRRGYSFKSKSRPHDSEVNADGVITFKSGSRKVYESYQPKDSKYQLNKFDKSKDDTKEKEDSECEDPSLEMGEIREEAPPKVEVKAQEIEQDKRSSNDSKQIELEIVSKAPINESVDEERTTNLESKTSAIDPIPAIKKDSNIQTDSAIGSTSALPPSSSNDNSNPITTGDTLTTPPNKAFPLVKNLRGSLPRTLSNNSRALPKRSQAVLEAFAQDDEEDEEDEVNDQD